MAEVIALRPRRPCPLCGKPSPRKYHPFRSNRCAQIDLHRWLGGNYAIPVKDAEEDEQDQS